MLVCNCPRHSLARAFEFGHLVRQSLRSSFNWSEPRRGSMSVEKEIATAPTPEESYVRSVNSQRLKRSSADGGERENDQDKPLLAGAFR